MKFKFGSKNKDTKVMPNPHRDWVLILIVTGILFTSIVLYNVYVFRKVADGTFILPSPESVIVKTLDKDLLSKAHSVIETKKQKLQSVLNGGVDVGDPSL